MDRKEKCRSCYWVKDEGNNNYHCCRYPPQYIQMWVNGEYGQQYQTIGMVTIWVKPEDFCGEWRPK